MANVHKPKLICLFLILCSMLGMQKSYAENEYTKYLKWMMIGAATMEESSAGGLDGIRVTMSPSYYGTARIRCYVSGLSSIVLSFTSGDLYQYYASSSIDTTASFGSNPKTSYVTYSFPDCGTHFFELIYCNAGGGKSYVSATTIKPKSAFLIYNDEGLGRFYTVTEKGVTLSGADVNNNVDIVDTVTYEGSDFEVSAIGENAFNYRYDLTKITIPATINYIGSYAFANCTSLHSVTVLSTTPPSLGTGVFFIKEGATLYVPKGCKALYEAASQWKNFPNIVELDEEEEQQCATPTIALEDFNLKIDSETPNATISTTIKALDHGDVETTAGELIPLTGIYTVTAVAKADGYLDSEPATATVLWAKAASESTGVDKIEMGTTRPMVIRSIGTSMEILGTSTIEMISVYGLDGTLFFVGQCGDGRTEIDGPFTPGTIYVVYVGCRTIKYLF